MALDQSLLGGGPAQERRLRAQGRQTLRRLLEAALVVFDRRGYHSARVDDICDEARTSHGTFYLYFSSKEDLFRALLNDVSAEMLGLSEALPSIAPDAAGYEALREWLGRFYDLYVHYHPVIRTWMDTDVANVDLEGLGADVLGGFARTLAARIAELDPPTATDPTTAALAAVAMVERFSFFSVVQIVPLERGQTLDTLATIMHVGLFAGEHRNR